MRGFKVLFLARAKDFSVHSVCIGWDHPPSFPVHTGDKEAQA
jgi:hypothetical protein